MKRILSILIILCMIFPTAIAEEEQSESESIWDSIGGWFSQAAEDTSQWASQAWEDMTSWISNAWGDASKWVSQVWNDSSDWISGIWGDASTWATQTYQDVSESVTTWWTDTFNQVTEKANNSWEIITEQRENLHEENKELFEKMIEAAGQAGDTAEENLHQTINVFLSKLNMSSAETEKIWTTIKAYAEEKGIAVADAAKIAMPYLYQLITDSQEEANGSIPAIAVAQYLTAVIEKNLSENGEDTQSIVNGLNEALNSGK